MLKKTLESPLHCKEIQLVHSKGDQSWVFFGRNDAKGETSVLWPPQEAVAAQALEGLEELSHAEGQEATVRTGH